MKPLSAKEVIAILIANGFILARTKGSHFIYVNPKTRIRIPVPRHGSGSKQMSIGIFIEIVKQSKIPKSEFEK